MGPINAVHQNNLCTPAILCPASGAEWAGKAAVCWLRYNTQSEAALMLNYMQSTTSHRFSSNADTACVPTGKNCCAFQAPWVTDH